MRTYKYIIMAWHLESYIYIYIYILNLQRSSFKSIMAKGFGNM